MSESKRLIDQNAFGRVDVALARGARAITGGVERHAGVKLWENGLGDVVEAFIAENVPARTFTAVDMARAVGILKKQPRRARPTEGER